MDVYRGSRGSGRVGWWVARLSSRIGTGGDVWHRWLSRSSGHPEGV